MQALVQDLALGGHLRLEAFSEVALPVQWALEQLSPWVWPVHWAAGLLVSVVPVADLA